MKKLKIKIREKQDIGWCEPCEYKDLEIHNQIDSSWESSRLMIEIDITITCTKGQRL